jgi:protein TonB
MFEQSMLADAATGKRTGAVAAALTVESLAVGVLILIPLIYSERIPVFVPSLPLKMPVMATVSDPPPVNSTRSGYSTHSIIPERRVFQWNGPPRTVPATSVISGDTPLVSIGIGDAQPAGFPLITAAIPAHIAPPPSAPPVIEPPKPIEKPLHVGGDVQAARLIRKVVPIYPEIARRARVSGTVRLVGVIAKNGTIEQLQVVSGNPLLIQAALDAVRQWLYRPTTLNGAAVEVIAPIDVIFTLQ